MSENAKLVQGKDFDSHTNLIEVINDNSEYAADTVAKNTEILHNVTKCTVLQNRTAGSSGFRR